MKNVEVIMRLWYNFFYKNNSSGPYEFDGFKVYSSNCNLCSSNYNYMETIVIYYGSITDTVITETSGGNRMGTTKIRTDEE